MSAIDAPPPWVPVQPYTRTLTNASTEAKRTKTTTS
jgi:hypothetical protein